MTVNLITAKKAHSATIQNIMFDIEPNDRKKIIKILNKMSIEICKAINACSFNIIFKSKIKSDIIIDKLLTILEEYGYNVEETEENYLKIDWSMGRYE